jgi:hypothetical protein
MAAVGSHRTVGQFLLLAIAVTIIGSILGRVPIGGSGSHMARAHLWLFPAFAIGLASAAQGGAPLLPARFHRVVGVGLSAVAVLVLIPGVGREVIYPDVGAREATRKILGSELGPDDVVWLGRLQVFGFALDADLPYDLEPRASRLVGFEPEFEDPRFVSLYYDMSREEMRASVAGARRVTLVRMYRVGGEETLGQALFLESLGFEAVEVEQVGGSVVVTLER